MAGLASNAGSEHVTTGPDSGRRGCDRVHRVPARRSCWENELVANADDAVRILEAGADLLSPVLSPAGFTFQVTHLGCSSGGDFATGRFTRGGQYLEFHVRHSVGLVTYGWDGATISHGDYLRGLGVAGAYPGYSIDPLDGFRHLALDLAGPLSGFRDGDRRGYERSLQAATQPRNRQLP
jgi:hypothetical protein